MNFLCFTISYVLCRLSSDLYTIDDSLPFILNILLANFVGLLGITIILCYVQVQWFSYCHICIMELPKFVLMFPMIYFYLSIFCRSSSYSCYYHFGISTADFRYYFFLLTLSYLTTLLVLDCKFLKLLGLFVIKL